MKKNKMWAKSMGVWSSLSNEGIQSFTSAIKAPGPYIQTSNKLHWGGLSQHLWATVGDIQDKLPVHHSADI